MSISTTARAVDRWNGPAINVYDSLDSDSKILSHFPIDFVRSGGCSTWRFVLDVVELLNGGADPKDQSRLLGDPQASYVCSDFAQGPSLLKNRADGSFICLDDTVEALDVVYIPNGAPCVPADIQATWNASKSVSSISGTASSRASEFRTQVASHMTSKCFASGLACDEWQACHLVPRSRIDVYQDVWGVQQDAEVDLDRSSAGVPLDPSLHLAYDNWRMSFYPLRRPQDPEEGEVWLLHYFCPPKGDDTFSDAHRQLHGRRLIVRGDTELRPDWRLARWHYAQTARLRLAYRPCSAQLPAMTVAPNSWRLETKNSSTFQSDTEQSADMDEDSDVEEYALNVA